MFLNPADYLSIEVVEDQILGGTVPQNRSGYDEWGFRNKHVPSSVDVVALGDSHTYGNTAKMIESWPYVVGQTTGLTVYNLGMGGYGPNQYYYLFNTKALKLNPRIILVGLYSGDDFDNAFRMTYGLEYWSFLRILSTKDVNADIWEDPDDPRMGWSWHKALRIWLSRHSVIYQLTFHGPLAAKIIGAAQIEIATQSKEGATTLQIKELNISEAFLPEAVLRGLDQDQDSVKEGIRITMKLLSEMNDMALQNGIDFVVVVIPTKEMVYAEVIEAHPTMKQFDLLRRLLVNERSVRDRLFSFFDQSSIKYIDPLPAMRKGIGQQIYARSSGDMHPGKEGYRLIGEAVSAYLTRRGD